MPFELLSPFIFSALAAIGLHQFRDSFQQAVKEDPNVKLKAAELLDSLAEDVLLELEDDVQRAFNPNIPSALGDDFLVQRRKSVAENLTRNFRNQTNKQIHLESLYQNWCNWENRGYSICTYGMILYALIALAIVVFAILPILMPPNTNIFIFLFSLILYPIFLIGICYFLASYYKRKFLECKTD